MEDRPYLSVIIPAYNESQRLPHALREMNEYLVKVDYSYEIVVVDDGSKDNTAQVVRDMASEIPNLRVIANEKNKGKGGVVRDGMLQALGQIRLFTDADNSTSLDQFEKMRPFFEQGYDVVFGSRAKKGARLDPPQPMYRRIPGKVGNIIIQTLVLPGIWDTQCGFKAFSAKAAEAVFSLSKITGWGFDVEILALSRNLGFKIKEIPVFWKNDIHSRVKASTYLQVLLETIRIRLWLWGDSYGIRSNKLRTTQ